MKYRYGPVGASVECQDCGWTTQSYKNAQAIAAIHARTNSHTVKGELVIYFEYDGGKA